MVPKCSRVSNSLVQSFFQRSVWAVFNLFTMPSLTSLLVPLLVSTVSLGVANAASCNADNCLRALRAPAKIVEAQSFCATFTTASAVAIPSYAVAACPNNSWTVHGLWPDKCDGTYEANCDPSREYTNITAILQSYEKTDLLSYMNTYWKDYQGNDETFWEHEWGKHGTCISTLDTKCYSGHSGQEEVVDYFEVAVELFKGLDSFAFLEKAGIVPSTTTTYTLAQIQDVLTAAHGFPVTLGCSGTLFEEIWYHYNVLGSVPTGEFVPTSPDGSKSDCPATGLRYVPKYLPATPTTSVPGSTPTGTPYLGKGFLQAYTGGANKGCLISAGTWYTTGTCATYTAATSGTGFTLTSSKGPCDIIAGAFSCAAGNTAGIFSSIDGSLAYADSTSFYAAAVPVGAVQQKVFTAVDAVAVSFVWQII
ncbi:hypothetical protein IFR05_005793 [Cadophora sp. M221]|nr:hypothetical protein IFR05_005793 [Cadophora sp. M221]